MKRRGVLLGAATLTAAVSLGIDYRYEIWNAMTGVRRRLRGERTVADVLESLGRSVRVRLRARFAEAGTPYPPGAVTLIGLKAERRLEVWVAGPDEPRRLGDHPILAASGGPGPKLREGDRQVPEGIYPITFLNANSRYYLSLRIGYPNEQDRTQAAREGRENLGGDIMIHGPGGSIGCLAMEQQVVEELFVLAADIGIENVRALLAPHDFRARGVPEALGDTPSWLAARYQRLGREMARYSVAGGG